MPISIQCPTCEAKIRVKDSYSGKKGRCPSCQGAIKIPKVAAAPEELIQQSPPRQPKTSSAPSPAVDAVPATTNVSDDILGFSLDDLRSEGEAIEVNKPKWRTVSRHSNSQTTAPSRKQSPATSMASLKATREKVLNGFSGSIKPVRRTLLYRIGVVLAACFVVILPVLYVALIALAGWGVYWHATENIAIASMGSGRGRVVAVMAYAAPIIAGGISVLFMLKPLLARQVEHGGRISLNRNGQPLLFEFVEQICDAIKAPHPSRIDVTFDINASAGYSGGIFSMLKSDLVLTIGLPLIAGMQLQHFSGILAHEFGHFSQGAAMKVSWIVRSINHWFAQVVYARDEWDEWLTEVSEETDIRIGWIFYIARAAVFLSRGILWCFMMLSALATCWLARQMEFDADRYEARLAGSTTFEETSFRLHLMAFGMQDYFRNMMVRQPSAQETGNPIRNFVLHCDSLGEHDVKRIRKRLQKAKTGLLDTHPADPERIANALRENTDGVFQSRLPAEALFQQFDKLCMGMMRI
ncbi:MAG: M48 family metalloprotease [Fuerstiella sp.]